ncbi:transporter substrate-binding domain-containing protein, partial [Staphylococcus epidermidis]|uniref:transporter substrate-binding domain-containing protein n=1 Tax=Staphylococcus epidermidis TaxID=1282 RepID=UPI0011A09791
DTLTVPTQPTYPPFTYHNKKHQLTPYHIHLIKPLPKQQNLKLNFNQTSSHSIFPPLHPPPFHLIPNQLPLNKHTHKKYKFSQP